MLDIIDCTGSGDVLMTEEEVVAQTSTSTDGSFIKSPSSGKLLKLSPEWTNPTGKYRIGQKSALDIFPKSLVDRLKRERKKEVYTYSTLSSALVSISLLFTPFKNSLKSQTMRS
jgi:tripeptidyl-peptidase-2